jgi:type I restriction-modification system DNA methylase subunit
MSRLPSKRSDSSATSPEEKYVSLVDNARRKEFGQFFTPPNVAALMAEWIAAIEPSSILDPALGTGILTRSALEAAPTAQVRAYEKDSLIASFADVGRPEQVTIQVADFLAADFATFDAVIANPPYIRHRELVDQEAARAKISVMARTEIPRSANLYIYFVMKAVLQLRRGGRAAFLIPTEWMNANFSKSFKSFLLEGNYLKEIVLFSGCSNVFSDALTTASILLIERPDA